MRTQISLVVLMLGLLLSPIAVFAKAETYAGLGSPAAEFPQRPHYNGDNGGNRQWETGANNVWFDRPQGGAVWDGQLYFADTGNHRIRRVRDDGFDQFDQIKSLIDTPVGSGNPLTGTAQGFSGDGGPARHAQLNKPTAVAFDDVGNMYIADNGNYRIRKVTGGIGGVISTIAGNGTDITPPVEPGDIWNGYGNLPTDTTVRNIVDLVWANGELYIGSSTDGLFYIATDGYLYQITSGYVRGLAVDPDGRVYTTISFTPKGSGLFRVYPNKSMVLVHSGSEDLNYNIQNGTLENASIHMGKIDFDAFGALFTVGLNSQYDEIYKVYNGNTIRNSFGNASQYEWGWAIYPTDIVFDRKNNRYFVINTNHEDIYVVSNLNEGGMTPMDGGDDVDGSCGLDSTTDGEVFSCNPVNLATGTKVDYVLDLGHNSPYPINWGRYYHSKKGAWTFEYERSLKVWGGSTRSFMNMQRPDGVTLNFKRLGNGAWERNMDLNNTVVNVPTTIMSATIVLGYEYKNLKDEVERYNADGQLQYIQSKEGWRLTMQYDGFGRLIKVSDSFNHVLNLTHSIPDSNNVSFLTSASDGERTIQYTFVRGNNKNLLTKVTNPLGYSVQYKYDTSDDPNVTYKQGRGLLTEIIAENGWRFARYTYDAMDRATSTVHFNIYDEINRNEFYYYEEAGVTDFVQNGLFNTAFVGKKWYTNGASKPRNISSPCLTCIGSKYRRSNYDERGNPIEQFDFNNVKSANTYDTTRNLLTSKIEAVGKPGEHMTAIEWHPQWRVPTQVVEEKLINDEVVVVTTTNTYNTNGQLVSSTVANDMGDLSRTQTITYNTQKLPNIITDAMGRAITLTYDQYGNVLTQTNNLGHITTYSQYTTSGIPRLTTYPNGLQRKLTLDANQQVTKMEIGTDNSYWRTTTFEYDQRGLLTQKVLPNYKTTNYRYDYAKRLIQVGDGSGQIDYNYDEYSRIVKETTVTQGSTDFPAPPNKVKEYTYDEFGRVLQEKTNPYWIVSYTYDREGNVTQITAPDLKKDFTYDEFNQITREDVKTNYSSGETPTQTNQTYYSNGLLKSASDERNVTTVYRYNGFGELIRNQSPDAGVQTIQRNKNGEVVKITDGRNVITEILRDGIGRVVQKIITSNTSSNHLLPSNQQQTFTYDSCPNGIGLVCAITNYSGTQTYAYNFWGDIVERSTKPAGTTLNFTIKHDYDKFGMAVKTEYPSGRWNDMLYNYDKIVISNISTLYTGFLSNGEQYSSIYSDRVLQNSKYFPLSDTFRWSRNPTGETLHEYDTYGNITKLTTPTMRDNGVPSTSPGHLRSRTYLHSWPFTNIFTQSQGADGVSEANFYDHSYKGYLTHSFIQLLEGGLGGSSAIHNYYEYDLAGNRTRKKQDNTPEGTVNYVYATDSNRLTSIIQPFAGAESIEYDNAGNIVVDNTRSYIYDGENRLRSVTGGVAASFEYNALGQRVKKDGVDGVEYFIYDEQGRILGVYNEDGSPKEELVWSNGWTPLATLRGKGANTQLYYIEVDHLDAPTHIRNEANQIVWSWNNREAFGYIAPNEDVDGNGTYFEFNLRFPGQWFDKETALFHNGFRDYNPSTGRYMQSDPLGLEAGFNTYAYVGNNPYRAVDPYGLKVNFTGETPMETKNLLRRSSQKSPLLFNALRTLHLSQTEYTIHTVKSGGSSYNPSTKTIIWNNNRINTCVDFSEILKPRKLNRKMYPAEGLYHEVAHAYLNEMGLTVLNGFANYREEKNALNLENKIRSELGYSDPGRTIFEYYWGWE